METNKNTEQTQNVVNKPAYLKIQRYYYSKDNESIILVLDGDTRLALHLNFLRARLFLPYTPKTKKQAA